MGIIFTTRDWLGAEIEVTHASGGGTFRIETVEDNAYDVAERFRAWLLEPGRNWAPDLTDISFRVMAVGARLGFAFMPVGTTFTGFTPNGVATSRIAVSPNADGSGMTGTMQGSISSVPATRGWQRWGLEVGARSQRATYRMGHGGYSSRRPSFQLAFKLADVAAWEESLRVAARPRRGYVYDEGHGVYRHGSFGRHKLGPLSDEDTTVFAGEVEFLGDP